MKKNKKELPDPLDSDEAIADLASYLVVIESAEELSAIQEIEGITPDRLRKACRLLPPSKITQIKDFAIANHKKRNLAN